jgi:hypothetical protein
VTEDVPPVAQLEAEMADEIRAALLIDDALADDPPPGQHRVVASPRLRVRIVTGLIRRGYRPPKDTGGRSFPLWAMAPEHSRQSHEDIAEHMRENGDAEGAARLLAMIDDLLAAEERKFQEYLRGERDALDND